MDRRAIEHGNHTNRTTNNEMASAADERAGHGGRGGAGTADLGMAAVRRASGGLEATGMVSRRMLLRRAAGVGVAALAVGALGTLAAKPAGASAPMATATAALNLRSGPSTSHQVLRVIPKGGTVVYLQGGSQNGFAYVSYDGMPGWASAQYLGPATGAPPPGGGLGSNGRTTATVNFREGPSTSARVIAVLPKGTAIFVHDVGASGFWSVAHNGRSGWIWADYIERTGGTPPPGGPAYDPNVATTTAALNLRAEPNTSAKVLLVMPAGAKVSLKAGTANGWRQVSYNGTIGWAATAYLN